MSLVIGRQGYLGLAIEGTSGTPESSPSVYIPFTDNSLEVIAEKYMDVSSRASRVLNHDAIAGRNRTEGDIGMYLDATNSGYLFKLALGQEVKTQVSVSPAVDNHQFFVTASGNSPLTATLWNFRGTGPAVKQSSRMAVNTLELEVTNDGLATMTANFMGNESNNTSAPTLATTSGTILSWANGCLRFGDTVAEAIASAPTKITNFTMSINNNVELLYRCGSGNPDGVIANAVEVTGSYTLYFEDDTHLNYYVNNSKKAMVLTLEGANLGGVNEQLQIAFDRVVLTEKTIETGQDTLFALQASYSAIQDTNKQLVVVNLQNGKTTVY
jgi:hypothetical protein